MAFKQWKFREHLKIQTSCHFFFVRPRSKKKRDDLSMEETDAAIFLTDWPLQKALLGPVNKYKVNFRCTQGNEFSIVKSITFINIRQALIYRTPRTSQFICLICFNFYLHRNLFNHGQKNQFYNETYSVSHAFPLIQGKLQPLITIHFHHGTFFQICNNLLHGDLHHKL